MTISSNLYAEKVFAEQPLALWALDDSADFLSILPSISDQQESWTVTNSNSFSVSYEATTALPMQDAYSLYISASEPVGADETVSVKYESVANLNTLNHSFGSLSAAFYLSASGISVSSINVGIQYIDPDTLSLETISNSYSFADNGWGFVGSTINIPDVDAVFDLVIDITYAAGAAGYDFVINGLSLGQWSEGTQTFSAGVYGQALPESIYTDQQYGVPAAPYGFADETAYYISSDNQLYARNTGSPMVYGASSSTKVYSNSGPSIIFPGFGAMNESGKYREHTIEFWLRVDTYTNEPRRIMGPIGKVLANGAYVDSTDGLYASGQFLMLKIGDVIGSHFVGEWGRPMLLDTRISSKSASLIVNGEVVISLSLDENSLSFPEKFIYDTVTSTNKDQDWLGIYSYEDLSVMEIDCIGIYPYRVPEVVAKRRFVYGQGVEFPENLNTAYNGASVFMDYSFSDYTNDYNYPDIGRWSQGATDNLFVNNTSISTPNYLPPSAVFSSPSRTYNNWLSENKVDNNFSGEARDYITLRPTDWSSENGYLFFNKLNAIGEDVAAIYAVVKPTENSALEQILVNIENETTGNYFAITLQDNLISYKFKYGNSEASTLYSLETIVPNVAFSVGLNIEKLANTYNGSLKTFFGNKDQLKVYVGGSKNFEKTFSGRIYNVGFCTSRNAQKVESFFSNNGAASSASDLSDVFYLYFDAEGLDGQIPFDVIGGFIDPISGTWVSFEAVMDGGFADSFVFGRFQDHIASYTMVPRHIVDTFTLDVAVDSYWEDYVPLSYLASYVSDGSGDTVLDLDFIQFNCSVPRPLTSPDGSIDTSGSIVRTYVTFQYLANGSNSLDQYFTTRAQPAQNHVVQPGSEWLQTKYEVVSGDIIKLPSSADFKNLSIGIHVEIQNPGTQTTPVKVKSLQLASQSLNFKSPNPVGTRFGYDIYPYSRSAIYYNYKSIGAYSTYKGSTPYLYTSKYSGIKVCGDPGKTGISIPINRSLVTEYAIGAIQFAMQYQEGLFPETATEIFEVESSNLYAKFYLVATNASRTRGQIYGINQETKLPVSGIAYYLNGIIVKDLFLEMDSWSIIGIQFSDSLLFEGELGAIRLTGPALFNNISYYQLPSTQTSLSVIFRKWNQLSDLANFWEDLTTPTQLLWQDILYISVEGAYIVDPSTIFREYSGTNRILVTSDKTLQFNSYKYSVYKDVKWDSSVVTPV